MPDKHQLTQRESLILTRKSQAASEASTGEGLPGTEQWRSLMRKFSNSQKTSCKTVPLELEQISRDKKDFPTGSSYKGTWDLLGMSGKGTYTFPHTGVVYKGEFDDGMFHGNGELHYQCGAVIKGKWRRGKLIERKLIFDDGLQYQDQEWAYCKFPDRRYTIEIDEGLQPAGRSYITAEQPPVDFPDGYYDCGDGLYNPQKRTVVKYDDLTRILRAPTSYEQSWIKENCRVMPNTSKGPCPFLYENWQLPEPTGIKKPERLCTTKTGQPSFSNHSCTDIPAGSRENLRHQYYTPYVPATSVLTDSMSMSQGKVSRSKILDI